jgi:CBS domain-containing protein
MRAKDVMTTEVIAVDPDTSVQALAALLSECGISGVPVVNADNRVVGVVSEGDLLHRIETGTQRRTTRRSSWWLDGIASDRELAHDYLKSHARTVKDVMTRDVVSVSDTTLAEIAMLLETKRIKRVPVVRDGKLVGSSAEPTWYELWRRRKARRRQSPIPTTAPSATSCSRNCGARTGWIFRRQISLSVIGSSISGSPMTRLGRRG